jgi:hypothetical protein
MSCRLGIRNFSQRLRNRSTFNAYVFANKLNEGQATRILLGNEHHTCICSGCSFIPKSSYATNRTQQSQQQGFEDPEESSPCSYMKSLARYNMCARKLMSNSSRSLTA